MRGLPLAVLCHIALSSLGIVDGLKCYECVEIHADLAKGIRTADTCQHKISAGETTNCQDSQPHCLKAVGTVKNGKYVEFRTCVGHDFKKEVGDKGCTPVKDVPNFTFNVGQERLKAESGDVCFCDTDKCNPATLPSPVYAFVIIISILTTFFSF